MGWSPPPWAVFYIIFHYDNIAQKKDNLIFKNSSPPLGDFWIHYWLNQLDNVNIYFIIYIFNVKNHNVGRY